jgi:hypothetical protein
MPNHGGMTLPQQQNKSALISLIAALLSLMFFWIIPVVGIVTSIVGVVYGHKSLKETQDTYNSGRGVGIAGLICGYAALGASFLWTVFALLMLLGLAAGTAP